MNSLDIRILGIVEYTDALEMMSELQRQRIEEEIPDTLLFLEHPEIVTIGPRARNLARRSGHSDAPTPMRTHGL